MARDLLSGGVFFVSCAWLAFLLASALPLWWFTSTELEGQQCSCGTGLWTGNWTWGQDITQPRLARGPLRCAPETPLVVEGCDSGFEGQVETRAKGYIAGVFSLAALLAASSSLALGYSVLDKQLDRIDVVRFRKGLCWAALAALMAIFCEVATICIFLSAPLFGNLGYDFGCHFVFQDPLNSNTLKCHALGPSFGLAVGGCILCSFACAMFYLAFKNPEYIDPKTGRYSMFQQALLGERPLDGLPHSCGEGDDDDASEAGHELLREPLLDGDESNAANNEDGDACGGIGGEEGADNSGHRGDEIAPIKVCAKMSCRQVPEDSYALRVIKLYSVPVLLMLNAALFVWSNCSTGATVEPNVVIAFPKELRWIAHKLFPSKVDVHGVVAFKDDVFNFTLFTSLRHFWEGKAYALAFLIGVMSGCWPYVKLFTMMFLWFVPSTEKLRGKMLHWLDVLGKWSLVDAYVLCLMAVAFGFDTDKDILGIRVHVDIAVRPGWGVYSFVLATMWSLCMSHYMSHVHRHAMERREHLPETLRAMEHAPHEALATRAYAPFVRRRRIACSRLGQAAIWFVLVATLAITLSGQLISTFEFRFSGLADLILPPEKRSTAYSLVSNGALLPKACSKGGFLSGGLFWSWFMTIMYFLFAMIIPLAMLVALAVLWGVPMTLASTKRVFHFCQLVQSWAALDVFLVSIIAAVLEIGGLSEAVIGDAFGEIQDTLCKVLKELPPKLLDEVLHMVGLPSLGPELDNCALFRVDAVLMSGCGMLLYGVAAWGLCTHLIMELADASIEERTRIVRVLALSGLDEAGAGPFEEDPYERLRIVPAVASPDSSGSSAAPHSAELEPLDGAEAQGPTAEPIPSVAATTATVPVIPGRAFVLAHHDTVTSQNSEFEEALNDDRARYGSATHVQSVYLRRILQAQEEGARRFMGTYFGDCMYGPFPREWWRILCKTGALYKVDWDRAGLDIHAALLMTMLSQESDNRQQARSHRTRDQEHQRQVHRQ